MRLISMTDFVLELGKQTEEKTYAWYYLKVTKYAQFLKQPLALDMFIGDKALFENVDEVKFKIDYTIEDLIEYDLTLTQYAIKQLGL